MMRKGMAAAALALALALPAFACPQAAFADEPAEGDNAVNVTQLPDSSFIYDTSITDFGYVYNYSIGSVGTIMRGVIADNGNIASTVAAAMPKAQSELDKLIATYMDTAE